MVILCESEKDKEAGMSETEVNCSYDEQRKLNRDPQQPEATYHRFVVVLTYKTVLPLTVWVEQFGHYKLLWKLRQIMRRHAIHLDIYGADTIQGITWIIIEYGRQYFSQSLMTS